MSDARGDLVEAMKKLRRSFMRMESTARAIDSHVSRTGSRVSDMIESAGAVAHAASGDADGILEAAEGVRRAAATARQVTMKAATKANLAEAGVKDANREAKAVEVAEKAVSAARADIRNIWQSTSGDVDSDTTVDHEGCSGPCTCDTYHHLSV